MLAVAIISAALDIRQLIKPSAGVDASTFPLLIGDK
jgi:hypothetical protein